MSNNNGLKKKREASENEAIAMNVSKISIAVNVMLSAFKLIAGIVAGSGAMVSDSIHSMSDVFSTFIVMAGVKISNKASDTEHPYGHERMECVAAIILAVILCATGVGIGYSGISKIISKSTVGIAAPGALALVAAVISIVVKEWMYWFTRAAAKKINSSALMADAWHHRSDALSSVGSFIGIFGARLGFPILDPMASVVICLFIIKAAYDIFMDAIGKMVDKACDEKVTEEMKAIIRMQDGVLTIDQVKTRMFGDKIYVDIEVGADGNKTLNESHLIAQEIHDAIESNFKEVKHCMVHMNPVMDTEDKEV